MTDTFSHILKKGENQTTEFKSTFNIEVIETLVAFANTKGGAVYIGINDNGKIVGVELSKESVPQWLNETRSKTEPYLIPDAEIIEWKGKKVVALYQQEYPIKPVSTKGRYYKRVNAANRMLSLTDIVNMHLQTISSSWDAYHDTTHTEMDISMDKVQFAIDTIKQNGISIDDNPITFLLKYNLLREGRITNAAYLLFKKEESNVSTIELGRFQNEIIIKDTARNKNDIIAQVEQVMDFVKKHINKEIIFTGKPQSVEKWQYPLEAIREIVVNMIVHRDYQSSSDSIVKIFNNKIEFFNPGQLPDGITVDDLLSNRYRSTPRNKLVADVFKDMKMIEKYGSGIKRIVDYFKVENLPLPEFTNISNGFMVTVFSNGVTDNVTDEAVNVTDGMADVTDNVTDRGINVTDETVNITDEAVNVTDGMADVTDNVTNRGINVTDEAVNVTDGMADVTDNVTNRGINVTDEAVNVTDGMADVTDNVTDRGINVTDETINVTDRETNVTDETINVTDRETNVTDKTVNVTDKTVNITDEAVNVTDGMADVTDNVTDRGVNVTDETINVTDRETNVTDKTVNITDEAVNVTDGMADVTDEREKRILGMIKANNRISLIQLAKNLSVTKMTIMRDIEKLKEKQKIKRYGNNKSGYWEIY